MRVLFDKNVPSNLQKALPGHQIEFSRQRNWDLISNGALLTVAEASGFEVMITADQNIVYQQNLKKRSISLIVLGSNAWPIVRLHIAEIQAQLNIAGPNSYAFIEMPLPPKVKRVEDETR